MFDESLLYQIGIIIIIKDSASPVMWKMRYISTEIFYRKGNAMIHEKISIKMKGSEEYAALYTYIQDYSVNLGVEKRPMVIICPGGGYDHTSDREAEPLALTFCAIGLNAAVLRYSVGPSEFPIALSELAYAVSLVRKNADAWHIDKDRILVQGSSAGGHLAACLGCFWNKSFLSKLISENTGEEISAEDIKPNGMILNYPVISSGTFGHTRSRDKIAGSLKTADAFSDVKGIPIEEFLSLEKQVSESVPPCFIWATFEDRTVPVENSLLMASALRKAGVSTELHIYAHGCHGLGLGTCLTAGNLGKEIYPEVNTWVNLVKNWLEGNFPITLKYNI